MSVPCWVYALPAHCPETNPQKSREEPFGGYDIPPLLACCAVHFGSAEPLCAFRISSSSDYPGRESISSSVRTFMFWDLAISFVRVNWFSRLLYFQKQLKVVTGRYNARSGILPIPSKILSNYLGFRLTAYPI